MLCEKKKTVTTSIEKKTSSGGSGGRRQLEGGKKSHLRGPIGKNGNVLKKKVRHNLGEWREEVSRRGLGFSSREKGVDYSLNGGFAIDKSTQSAFPTRHRKSVVPRECGAKGGGTVFFGLGTPPLKKRRG